MQLEGKLSQRADRQRGKLTTIILTKSVKTEVDEASDGQTSISQDTKSGHHI